MERIIEENLIEIKRLFKHYGAQRAFLFGSAADGRLKDDSDVDFLFSFPTEMHYETYANNYFDLMESLQNLLKREIDLVAEKTLRNPFLIEKIDSQKIQLI